MKVKEKPHTMVYEKRVRKVGKSFINNSWSITGTVYIYRHIHMYEQ